MKKFMSFMIVALYATLMPVVSAYAQVTANGFLGHLEGDLKGVNGTVKTVVQIVIGLIGTIYVAINLIKYFRGQGDSQNSLLRVVIGIVVALIILGMIQYLG